MPKLLQNGNRQRLTSIGIGMLVANFLVAVIVDQLKIPLHINVVTTGALLVAAAVNILMSKFNNGGK